MCLRAHAMLIQEYELVRVHKLSHIVGEYTRTYVATGYLKAGLELSRRIIARGKSNETFLFPLREELRRTIIFSRRKDKRGSPVRFIVRAVFTHT